MDITFYGVRGSCPCPDDGNLRYGGNTACVALTVEGEAPILLDLGTGLRCFGATQPLDGSFRATALVTHTHWDHVQGLPFFPPADRVGAELDVYGPAQETGSLCEVFDGFIRPPLFPIRYADLRGKFRFHDVLDEDLAVGSATVRVRPVPHIGPTVGYQVRWGGATVAYISDHQAPPDHVSVADSVMDLLDGTDVLIHDAQYTPEEFAEKAHWGHCTIDYAVHVARLAGVPTVVLFHHDPAHDDDVMDRLVAEAQAAAGPGGPTVVAAYEGLRLKI
ncbi:MAG: MBL fold metallo-hydrolase [Acidimicrobiaceae bacterium]|nr:MBL fold metallo-hydrolase [Acidimicrobiaceae bacterium]